MTGDFNLGRCCACGGSDDVVNAVCLPHKTPYAWGWGCACCGLPDQGAIAVLCDDCIAAEAPIREFVKGPVAENERAPIEELTEAWEHDLSQHPEIGDPDAMNEGWEAIAEDIYGPDPTLEAARRDCDPVVLYDPSTGESLTESELTAITDRIAATVAAHGAPQYWRNEASGKLQPAIIAFVNHWADPRQTPAPTPEQLGYVIQYFQLWANFPGWKGPEIEGLRSQAQELQTVEDCARWLEIALEVGIDPL